MKFSKYLQDSFDSYFGSGIFKVAEEQQSDIDALTHVVIKEIGGDNYQECATYDYNVQILTLTPMDTMEQMRKFTIEYNQIYFAGSDGDAFNLYQPLYGAPICIANYLQANANYYGLVQFSVRLVCTFDVSGIEHIKIDNRYISCISKQISYSATPNSQRNGNSAVLNETHINRGITQLTLQVINKNIPFCNKIVKGIAMGLQPLDISFSVIIKFTNDDTEYSLTMRCLSFSFIEERGGLPNDSIVLIV